MQALTCTGLEEWLQDVRRGGGHSGALVLLALQQKLGNKFILLGQSHRLSSSTVSWSTNQQNHHHHLLQALPLLHC